MKNLIEVKEIELPESDLFLANTYPSAGMFIVNKKHLMAVCKYSKDTLPAACSLGPIEANEWALNAATEQPAVSAGIDSDIFLKTVAIIRNPELGAKLF